MSICDLTWSKKEKEIARHAFDKAYRREMESFKREIVNRVNRMNTPEQIWDLHDYLSSKRKELDRKYDYRYSQLIIVFGRLFKEGYISEEELRGLDDEKLTFIRNLAGKKK